MLSNAKRCFGFYRRVAASALATMTFGYAVRASAVVLHAVTLAPLVFDHVTVVDVEHGQLLQEQRVVVVGSRIIAVGNVSAVQIPQGAHVVDAHGKYLIPGLWDMHTHPMRSTDIFYPLFIANGVTGIRDASSPVPVDTLRLWQREILAGTRVGPPRQLLAGKAIDEAGAFCEPAATYHVCVTDSANASHVVDSLKAAGTDFIKTWATYRHMWFILAHEARRIHIPLGGHLPDDVTAIEASDSGATIVDHVDAAGDLDVVCLGRAGSIEHCTPVVTHFRQNGTWWCPTLVAQAPELSDRAQSFLTQLNALAARFLADSTFHRDWLRDSTRIGQTGASEQTDSTGYLAIAHRVGLPILAGTDVSLDFMINGRRDGTHIMPGFSLQTELALYVAEGLTPLEALQTATLNPAKYLHGTDSLGTVAPGKLADLVLLDANPLVDITNLTTIRGVVANGRYFDRAMLDQLVAAAETKSKHV